MKCLNSIKTSLLQFTLLPKLSTSFLLEMTSSQVIPFLTQGEGKKGMRAIYEGATIYSPYEEQQLQAF